MTEDPRIEELLEYTDAVDDKGEPTAIALIARRVATYIGIVDELRDELDESHGGIEELEARAENLSVRLTQRASVRDDITQAAQQAAVSASFATNTGRSAELRKESVQKQKELKQFISDYELDERRFKEVNRALEAGHARLMETRDKIARRMNIIDALLQRAEIAWPAYFFEENSRLKPSKSGGARVATRPRGRGRRRVIRRRKAG